VGIGVLTSVRCVRHVLDMQLKVKDLNNKNVDINISTHDTFLE